MATGKIGVVLALDGEKKFVQQVQNANKETAALKAEMKNLSVEFDGNANSAEYLTKKQEILTKQQDVYKKKLEAAQNGLKTANQNYENQTKRLTELKNELETAQKKLSEMGEAGEKSSKTYKEQEKAVENLKNAVERQTFTRNKEIGSISDWTKKINVAETELKKNDRAIKQNGQYIEEAEKAFDGCAKSIDEYGEKVKDATEITSSWGEKAKNAFANAVVTKGLDIAENAVKKAAEAVKDSMYDMSAASTDLQAQTGLSEAAMERYNDVMQEIKGNNFGEDYSDVASVMAEIVQIMGELDPTAMQDTTEAAITLRDTFGMDINEQLRAVDVMTKTMGVDATQAFNLIAAGAQRGLNRSGELVDNITEYAQLWGQAGFSAEEMFAILENGLDSGAYNLDKVNDYVKEFGNSLADGRIEENLDSFSDGTKELFEAWKKGEATTSDVFYSVINDLANMTSQQEALTLASEVWSALGEDNAMQVITSLGNVNTAYANVKGTLDEIKEVKYSDLESAISGLGAAIQEKFITPIADIALPAVTKGIEGITELIDPPKTKMEEFMETIKSANEELETSIENARNTMDTAGDEAEKIEALSTQLLSLNGIEYKSVAQKYQLKQVVEELGTMIPEIAAAYDEEAGKINLSEKAIRELVASTKELMVAQAAQTALQETINAQVQAEVEYRKAENARSAAESKLRVYEQEKELLLELQNEYARYEQEVSNAGQADDPSARIKEIEENFMTAEKAAEKYKSFWDGVYKEGLVSLEEYEELIKSSDVGQFQNRLEENISDIDYWSGAVREAGGVAENLENNLQQCKEETDEYSRYVEESVDSLNKQKDAADDLTDSADDLTESLQNQEKAWKASAETAGTAAQGLLDTYNGYVNEIKNDLQNKISLFDKFDTSSGGEDMTVEQMQENLNSQIAAYEEYEANLAAVKEHVGKEIAPEFMQYLESMGLEGSNTLKHIIATFEEGDAGAEKVRELSDTWVESMDMTEGMAEVGAANQVAYEAMMGELGSSDEEFASLGKAIDHAVDSAAEGWSELPKVTKDALDETVAKAKACGVTIPEGLASGIASGEISADDAMSQLNGAIQGTLDGLLQMAEEAGIELDSAIAEGIADGSIDSVEAFEAVVAGITEQYGQLAEESEQASSEAGDAMSAGLEGKKAQVGTAGAEMAGAGADAAQEETKSYKKAGSENADAYIDALNASRSKAAQSGGAIASAARNALASYKNGFYNTGYNLSAGVASGIRSGQSGVVNAMTAQISAALAAAKEEADIHSPSRKFQNQVGLQMANGVAFGVKKGTGKAKKSAKKLAEAVLDAATSWLDKYQATHALSLKDEEYYWQQVLKKVKKSSKAYTTALKNIQNVQSKIGTVSNMSTLLSNYQTYFNLSEKAEVDYWDAVRKRYAAGTEERLEADEKYLKAKEKHTEKLKDLEEDYLDAVKDVNDELQDSIDEVNQAYDNKLQERTDAIKNAFGLFDEFYSESADGKTLLFNIKAQAAGYEDWMEQLDELSSKGILNEELLKELTEMGPQMSASIHALNMLSEEELSEYNEAYLKKVELSGKQAAEETKDLKEETASKIEELKEQASKDLESLKQTYEANVKSVNTNISSSLLTLAKSAKKIAEDQTAVLVAAIKDSVNVKSEVAGSTGSNVSDSVKTAASVTSNGLPEATSSGSSGSTQDSGKEDKILKAINSGKSRSKTLTKKEKKEHHALWEYIVSKYGRTPTNAIYKTIASELGVTVSKTPTKAQKDKILKKLKAKGYRTGARNIDDEYIWMDEELQTKGPELIVRKNDGAMLTRLGSGAKSVIPADLTENLFKWGASRPEDINAILEQMQAQIQNRQASMAELMNEVDLGAGIVKLNRLLESGAAVQMGSSVNLAQLEESLSSMMDLMSRYLPYLAERQQVTIRKQDIVDSTAEQMGTALAMMSRRRRKV